MACDMAPDEPKMPGAKRSPPCDTLCCSHGFVPGGQGEIVVVVAVGRGGGVVGRGGAGAGVGACDGGCGGGGGAGAAVCGGTGVSQ